MTNRLAIILGVLLVGALLYDVFTNDGTTLLFLMRRFVDLIQWLAFWR